MTFHEQRKLSAAAILLERIEALIETNGQQVPCMYPGAARNAVLIEMPPLRIDITPDRIRTYAEKVNRVVRPSIEEVTGAKLIDISVFGDRRASLNIVDGEISIYEWKPGIWETQYFGIDTQGDTIPVLPTLFVDAKDPSWVAFTESRYFGSEAISRD